MKNRIQKSVMLLILAVSFLFCGCKQEKQELKRENEDLTTINILLIGENLKMDRVLEKYEEELAHDLGIKLKIEVMHTSDYRQEISFKMESQEKLDLVFNAPWLNMSEMIAQGKYLDLEKYFNNSDYPGLSKAFPEEYLDANRFNGHLYGVPVSEFLTDTKGIAYRKDLLEEYDLGFERITDLDQLKKFYDTVLKKEKIAPIWLSERGFFKMFSSQYKLNANHIHELPGWPSNNVPVYVALDEEEKNVKEVLFLGDEDRRFSNLGNGFTNNFLTEQMKKNTTWAIYSQDNSLMSYSSDTALTYGLTASIETSIGSNGLVDKERELKKTVPEAKLDFFSYNEEYYQDLEQNSIPTIMQAWNFVCIPAYSENADITMKFLDWLYGSQEHLYEFSYGLEGVHWERKSENSYRVLQSEDSYIFPAFAIASNPQNVMYLEGVTEEQKQFLNIQKFRHPFYSSNLSGFILDTSRIAGEINNIEGIYGEYYMAFNHGSYGTSILEKIQEFYKRAEDAGLEKVRNEIRMQVQKYLDKR